MPFSDHTIYSPMATIPVAVHNRTYITEWYGPYYEVLLLHFCAEAIIYVSTVILFNLSVIDRSCETLSSIRKIQVKKEHPTSSKTRKSDWIGHILRRTCLLKHIIEGKVEGTGRGG